MPDKTDSKNKLMLRIGIGFLCAVIVGFVVWLVATGEAASFVGALSHAHLLWVLGGLIGFLSYFLLDALCFRIAGTLTGVRMGLLDLLSVAAVGIVFGYLTPGQMGAAPAQIVRLSKAGLSVGAASGVQLTRFFVYQSAVTLFGAAMLLAKFRFFEELYGNLVLICVLSFGVHLAIMGGLVAVIFFPNLVRRVVTLGVRLLSGRIHLIKDGEAVLARVEAQIDQYATSVHAAIRHPGVVISAIVITIAQLVAMYSVPYFVLNALGAHDLDFFTCLAAAAFVQLILTAVPLPGGTGGAEGGFALFFGPSLGSGLVAPAIVLWRSLTFYLPILISAPLMGLRSRVTPAERLETFGEPPVGRAAIAQDLANTRVAAREKADRLRQRIRVSRQMRGGLHLVPHLREGGPLRRLAPHGHERVKLRLAKHRRHQHKDR
ncbi:MAG: flippase-like domain-containing protein [Coriobacteriia bacterium]|nr:flippase-like domain-containing protein [Coriobacteriia bacterium]MBS5478414.1 flippase-like domain-containing protein [Coriobacteriia bacterium]